MDIIQQLKNKSVELLNLQDEAADECKNYSAGYIMGNQEATDKYFQAENKFRKYSEQFSSTIMTVIVLTEMQYAMEDMGDAIHLN